ncbi:lanthionine synthetase LanC family protein [Bradyrhizobium sp. B117]|uniref:lanthionine synthetase LanC family protein n=1 Tax=Bradyrhizobium sp. B117 TaxID=3140246 RepID=UPI0031837235
MQDASTNDKLIGEMLAAFFVKPGLWEIVDSDALHCGWTNVRFSPKKLPAQGIKLHITATPNSAESVLRRVLPVLLAHSASFKVTATISDLQSLLNGRGGLTQVGKFITVYPDSDEHAVSLGLSLHEATKDIPGPHIPCETSLGIDSLVHYRFGAFDRSEMQLDTGRIVGAIRDGTGKLAPDDRFAAVSESHDPFARAGIKTWSRVIETVLRDRYLRVDQLGVSGKGIHSVGIDLHSDTARLVLIKEAHRGIAVDRDGIDAFQRLLAEAAILAELQQHHVFPTLVDSWAEKHRSFLVYEFIEGTTIQSVIGELASKGLVVQLDTLRKWALDLCGILRTLHGLRIVFGDLKPSNIIIDARGGLHLVDFELAHHFNEPLYAGFGTRGYAPPSQLAGMSAATAEDDIYSFGATIVSAAAAMDLSLVSGRWDHNLILEEFGSQLPDALKFVLMDCLHSDRSHRPSLDVIVSTLKSASSCGSKRKRPTASDLDMASALTLAESVGQTILMDVNESLYGAHWVCRHDTSYGSAARDLYVGTAGVALFLLNLHETTRKEQYLCIAEKAARWLHSGSPCIGRAKPLPGLYYGEAGVGLYYSRLYQVTRRQEYLDWAASASDLVWSLGFSNPDLLTGAAGTGLFHLLLSRLFEDDRYLERAIEAGKFLISSRSSWGWRIPPGYEGLSGNTYLGFAHGAAGIAYFLCELYMSTGEFCYIDTAMEVAAQLSSMSHQVLDDRTGIAWPDVEGGEPGFYWCHGTAGIGRFFLKLFESTADLGFLGIAIRCGETVAKGARRAGTTQCHGLAGSIELLLDLRAATGRVELLDAAFELGTLLARYGVERAGTFTWQSESPDLITSDFMVGQAGIGECFLRLADPRRLHHISITASRLVQSK